MKINQITTIATTTELTARERVIEEIKTICTGKNQTTYLVKKIGIVVDKGSKEGNDIKIGVIKCKEEPCYDTLVAFDNGEITQDNRVEKKKKDGTVIAPTEKESLTFDIMKELSKTFDVCTLAKSIGLIDIEGDFIKIEVVVCKGEIEVNSTDII